MTSALSEALQKGDRRALARAITLVESNKAEHRVQADEILEGLPKNRRGHRIGISGTPGVGKSTFIESFGLLGVQAGKKIAVLAIDPSSPKTGGSILGDKTRMNELSRHPNAFIRPSPSQGSLGGVAPKTHDAILLCEAAGFDTIFVETVGTGQSEVTVSELTDTFLLLIAPSGGDELQGVKRGVLELCDLLFINKADGALYSKAEQTQREYRAGLQLLRGNNKVRTALVSALSQQGLDDAWAMLEEHAQQSQSSGDFDKKRRAQRARLLKRTLVRALETRFFDDETKSERFDKLCIEVADQKRSISNALHLLLREG